MQRKKAHFNRSIKTTIKQYLYTSPLSIFIFKGTILLNITRDLTAFIEISRKKRILIKLNHFLLKPAAWKSAPQTE